MVSKAALVGVGGGGINFAEIGIAILYFMLLERIRSRATYQSAELSQTSS